MIATDRHSSDTPLHLARDGFRMPAETDPHRRTWMQWPTAPELYASAHALSAAQAAIAMLAQTIATHEEVVMLAGTEQAEEAQRLCGHAVQVQSVPVDDMWVRDSGPTFVKNARGEVAIANLNFNAWGNKQPHARDAQVAAGVGALYGFEVLPSALTSEGGAIEVDGAGTLLTTESSVLNDNRNPGMSRAGAEQALQLALGIREVIWLPGLAGEDITDGHVDAIARFVQPGLVLVEVPADDAGDSFDARVAEESLRVLSAARDAAGRPLEIQTIQAPRRINPDSDAHLFAYINYYVCNGAVIMPRFGQPKADAEARARIGALYPGRVIEQIDVDAIYRGGGGIHCTTQQQPVGAPFQAPGSPG